MHNSFWECPFCKKQIVEKNKYSKSGHLAKCKEWKKYKDEILTKEYLYHNYIKLGKSAYSIAIEHGLSSAISVINLLKSHGISTRSISEATRHPNCNQKKARTNMKRYGYTHNFNKDSSSRIEWEDRLLEDEGIINVFQRDDVKEKTRQTLLRKYGASHPMLVPEIKQRVFSSRNIAFHRISTPQMEIIKFIENMGVNADIEVPIVNGYVVDILCNHKIIEVFGDYWHANPSMFSPNTIMNYPAGSPYTTASDRWKFDYERMLVLQDAGYQMLVLWENDIKNNMIKVGSQLNTYLSERK